MRGLRACWILAIACVLTAGCGKEPATETPPQTNRLANQGHPSAAAESTAITMAELDKVEKASKPYKLVLIVKTRNNPFFDPMIKAFEAECKALGAMLEVQAPPQETDKEQQFSMVETVAAKGVDAILIAPADSKGIVPALKKAQDKNILVVNIDNRVDKESASASGLTLGGYVGADNEAGGKMAGEEMAKGLAPNAKVAILEGIRGADNAEARKRGFTVGADGKVTIAGSESANWDTQQAYTKFSSVLAANPDLAGVFCANDKMALGAIKAISEANKKGKIKVIGYDNIADVKPYLKSGEMHATIEQHPDLMGKYGARMAVGILNGSIPKGKENLVSLELIKQ